GDETSSPTRETCALPRIELPERKPNSQVFGGHRPPLQKKTANGSCDIATANFSCEFSTRTSRSLKASHKLDIPAGRTTWVSGHHCINTFAGSFSVCVSISRRRP